MENQRPLWTSLFVSHPASRAHFSQRLVLLVLYQLGAHRQTRTQANVSGDLMLFSFFTPCISSSVSSRKNEILIERVLWQHCRCICLPAQVWRVNRPERSNRESNLCILQAAAISCFQEPNSRLRPPIPPEIGIICAHGWDPVGATEKFSFGCFHSSCDVFSLSLKKRKSVS